MADVNESNAYVVTQGRKLYGVPTDFGFCVKVRTQARPGVCGGAVRAVQILVSCLWLVNPVLRNPANYRYTCTSG